MNMSKVENLPSLSDKFFMKYTYIYFLKSILMQFGRFSVSGAKRDLSHYFVRHFDVTVGSLARYQSMPVVLISREQSRTNMVKIMKYTYIYFLKSILMQFGRFSVSGAKRDLSYYFVRPFDLTVGSLSVCSS